MAALYGLHWDMLVHMPRGELIEHIDQMSHWTAVHSAGMANREEA